MPFMFIEPIDCGGLVCDCGEGNPESVPSVVAEQGHGREGPQGISGFSAAKPEANEVAAASRSIPAVRNFMVNPIVHRDRKRRELCEVRVRKGKSNPHAGWIRESRKVYEHPEHFRMSRAVSGRDTKCSRRCLTVGYSAS